MAINFPDSPANGATYTVGSTTWTYYASSSSWRAGSGTPLPASISLQNTTSTAVASGANSIAIGTNANTVGSNAISLGTNSNTTTANSISVGTSATSSGNNAVTLGVGALSSGSNNTITIGAAAQSTNNDTVAIGANAVSSNTQSMALGSNSLTSGVMGTAVGANSLASGTMSLVLGANSQATAAYAVAIGANVISSTANTIVIGTNTQFVTIAGGTTLSQSSEVYNTKTGATGVVTHDFATGSIFYHSSMAANFTANFTNVPTTDGRTNIATLILVQGATPYYPNAVQIAGISQSIKWLGGSAPSATANRTELVSFTMIRVGATWTVTGSLSSYG